MVVLVSSKPNHTHKRLQAKLDHLLHHHKPKPEAEPGLAALQSFRAELSDGLRRLIVDSKELSLTWVEQGLKLLHGLNRSFAKFVEAVDCPMSKWESSLVDEYLGYTLEVLDLFNSMSSSLAHLRSVRLALAHALGSPSSAARRLLQSSDHDHDRKWAIKEGNIGCKGDSGSGLHGKQGVVLQGVVEMKGVGLWVCGVIVSGLGGEVKVGSEFPLLVGIDSRICGEMMERGGVLKEVKEVNEMVGRVLAAPLVNGNGSGEESKEMKGKVERFQRKLEEVVEEVNCLFSEVLASRNRLMDCFRLQKE